jgi:hypothetical protein
MKIYEKPMAIVEKINCEDIMAVSQPVADATAAANAYTDLKEISSATEAIIFEW